MFETHSTAFTNCIPAIGEGSRIKWPDLAPGHQRQLSISHLKSKNPKWKSESKILTKSWKLYKHENDITRRDDLYCVKSSVPDLCLYSIDEVRWIKKNYRALEKRLGSTIKSNEKTQ